MTNDKDIISFFQGAKPIENDDTLNCIKSKIAELSNLKNINFLFGAGTSSDAIPTMGQMHKELKENISKNKKIDAEVKTLFENLNDTNLESILGVLYSQKSYLDGLKNKDAKQYEAVSKLIEIIESFMFSQINIDLNLDKVKESLTTYKMFYQKTTLRNKDLSRVNVFTTNNDLLNEKALDDLNINFNNGFGGGLEKVFNPARFNYTYSRKVDANLEKFEPLENMVYLYKLHGSISWVEKLGNDLFNIHEVHPAHILDKKAENQILIYPTPLKQNQSLGSPYSDLIREFKIKLGQPHSALFIIGYSFSDEHLNNIIYQSLASNSSLSIFIFGEHENCPLSSILDNRIYRAYGTLKDGVKIHYFNHIVQELLPNLDKDSDSSLLEDFKNALSQATVNKD